MKDDIKGFPESLTFVSHFVLKLVAVLCLIKCCWRNALFLILRLDRSRKKETVLHVNFECFILTPKDFALIFVNNRKDDKERAAKFIHNLFNLMKRLGKKIEIQSRRGARKESFEK